MERDPNDTEFLLTETHDIRATLFELTHPDSHIMVRDAADRQIAVSVLGAEKKQALFYWRPRDFAQADFSQADSDGVLLSSNLHFHAMAYSGTRIHFKVPRPQVVSYGDTNALASPFPEKLLRIQRRKMFRASIINTALPCNAHWTCAPLTKRIDSKIRDISIDGVGLRITSFVKDLPERGSIIDDAILDFGDQGSLQVSLLVENIYPVSGQNKPDETPADSPTADNPATITTSAKPKLVSDAPVSHLGASFVGLNARQETWLQALVWRLEKIPFQ